MTVCQKCVMDTSSPEINFDQHGVCNYCNDYEIKMSEICENLQQPGKLANLVSQLKSQRKGKYDVIIGVSGGVDSSYATVLAHKFGLNALLIHFDNGWNAPLAVSNIKRLTEICGFDLYTYVVNWPEFRDLQRSFIKAGVLDIEMITDQAILSTMLKFSRKFKVKNVLSGNNIATELGLPKSWSWNKRDYRNLRAIHRQYGEVRLKTYPGLSTWRWLLVQKLNLGMTFIEILNYFPYKKLEAIAELQSDFGWQYYGGKHYESTFTKFYQAYILPRKFQIDKRKAHFSGLIRNGEMSRQEAMDELERDPYPPDELAEEKPFVLKKLGFSETEFDQIMSESPRKHNDFASDEPWLELMIRAKRSLNRVIPSRG